MLKAVSWYLQLRRLWMWWNVFYANWHIKLILNETVLRNYYSIQWCNNFLIYVQLMWRWCWFHHCELQGRMSNLNWENLAIRVHTLNRKRENIYRRNCVCLFECFKTRSNGIWKLYTASNTVFKMTRLGYVSCFTTFHKEFK